MKLIVTKTESADKFLKPPLVKGDIVDLHSDQTGIEKEYLKVIMSSGYVQILGKWKFEELKANVKTIQEIKVGDSKTN